MKAALKWTGKLWMFPKEEVQEDVYYGTRLLSLIIHFELGNMDALPYYAKSFERYISKYNAAGKTEKMLIHFFSKESGTKETSVAFKYLKEKLSGVRIRISEQNRYDLFDLAGWIESKIRKCSFDEVVRTRGFYSNL